MIIGIDGNEANVLNKVGVNQYAYKLLWSLSKIENEWKDKHIIIVYLKSKPLNLPKETDFFKYVVLKNSKLWIITKLMPYLFFSKNKPDVFFTPHHYTVPFSFVPRISAIMDLGYLEFSGQFKKYDYWQLKLWSAWSMLVSKYIISISNTTKKDILKHYKFAKNKTFVTLLGFDKNIYKEKISNKEIQKVKNKFLINENEYVLFLSTLKPSKNVVGLIKAYSLIKNKLKNTKLVIAGKKGWLYEEIFKLIEELQLNKDVIFTDFVSESEKHLLIAGAKVFCLPSFWEGFGLDVVSAMALKVPVVVSNRGSLPEVVGKHGVIVAPESKEDIANGLLKTIQMSKSEKEKMTSNAKKYVYQTFDWDKTARETLKIIDKIKI